MKYDIASKVIIIEASKEAILRKFLGLEPSVIEKAEELPEETFSLMRSDYHLRIAYDNGQEAIVIIEIQTRFSQEFIWRLIDYTARYMIKYKTEIIPLVLLLSPSEYASGIYRDKIFEFKYNVIRFWEKKPEYLLDEIGLYPFLPLTDGGDKVLYEAEVKIYESKELTDFGKANLLTAMAIFAGLKDKTLTHELIKRRRDIMIQSAAYDIIKEEGMREGIKEGMKEGLIEDAREMLLEALNERFGDIPKDIFVIIKNIDDRNILKFYLRYAIRCASIDEFKQKITSQ